MKYTTHISALLAALSTSLLAQETSDTVYELNPVVVTGELWESELQNSTASVTVLDQDALNQNGVRHFEDVVDSIPNLTWTGGTSRPRYLQIRGIGENSQYEGETPDSTVRFLMDDFDLTGVGTVASLFDVQQVEVLRGPQAGAFGANAAGGVVKIVSNEPTSYWTGQAEATIGNDSLYELGLAVGGPIIEKDPEQLTFRFSINSLNRDGFRENQFLDRDDTNERDELTSRLKVRWLPNELWSFEGGLLYAEADNGFDEFTLTNNRTDTFTDEPGRDEQESQGISLRGTYYGFEAFEVTYVTSFLNTESLYSFDGDWTDPAEASSLFGSSFLEINRDRDVYTQDLRFDSSDREDALGLIDRWTAGIYYQSLQEDTATTGFGDFETDYASEAFSLYTQGTHLINDRTRVTLGLRAEYYDLETAMDFRDDVDFDDWLFGGKLTLEHDINKEQTAFASVTRGYKAGGANIYPFLAPSAPVEYDTENLWNYEIGLRSEWLDGDLSTQITLFYLDRDDVQLRDSDGEGVAFSYFTTNGEGADHYGAEAEATWRFAKNWSLNANLGLLETDRDSYVEPRTPNPVIPSRELANAPTYTYSARLNYDPGEGFFASAEVAGRDEYYESNSHDEKRNAYAVVNGSIGYRWDHFTLTLWAKNLFDEEYEERVFYFNNGTGQKERYEAPAAPRTFGLTANYRW